MNRRELLAATAAALAVTALPARADGAAHVPYSRDVYEKALASGAPFMLDFYAEW